MRIYVQNGLLWTEKPPVDGKSSAQTILNSIDADVLANSNGFKYAESFAKDLDGQVLEIDENGKMISHHPAGMNTSSRLDDIE